MSDLTLEAYHGWLYTVAASMLPDGYHDAGIDDLVQEGRIAMWRSTTAYDPSKGALPSWVTRAARTRMRDVARGHCRFTGYDGRKGYTDMMHPRRPRVLSFAEVTDECAS